MDELTWRWTPVPHLDAISGLAPGELLLNALLYAAALVVSAALLRGASAAIRTAVLGFRDGYRGKRN